MATRSYTDPTLKKLFGLSGNQCACPNCPEDLIDDKKNILGEICHIHGLENTAKRHDPNLSAKKVNDYENLILLCPNHHTKADNDPKLYTSKKLIEMKNTHEEKVRPNPYQIDDQMMSIISNHFNQNQINVNTGSGSQFNTQSGDITTYVVTDLSNLEKIGEAIFDKNYPKLQEDISEIAKKSAMSFLSELVKQGREKLSNDDKTNLSDPDLHYILNKAIINTGRNNDPNFRKNLANLMIGRIKNSKSNLKKIVYDEAIITLPKLTLNQLKILTCCFLLRNAKFGEIEDEQSFEKKYKPIADKLFDFHESNAEIQHTVYTGIVSSSIGSWDFKRVLKIYPGLNIEKAMNTPTGKRIESFLKKSLIKNLNPTSVGIVIATMFFENLSGIKVDIDIFIN